MFSIIDVLLVLFAMAVSFVGYKNGFIRQAFILVALIAPFFISLSLTSVIIARVDPKDFEYLSFNARYIISFLLYIVVAAFFVALGMHLKRKIDLVPEFKRTDNILGSLFSVAKVALIVYVVSCVHHAFADKESEEQKFYNRSRFYTVSVENSFDISKEKFSDYGSDLLDYIGSYFTTGERPKEEEAPLQTSDNSTAIEKKAPKKSSGGKLPKELSDKLSAAESGETLIKDAEILWEREAFRSLYNDKKFHEDIANGNSHRALSDSRVKALMRDPEAVLAAMRVLKALGADTRVPVNHKVD